MAVYRIIVAPRDKPTNIYTIYNLEINDKKPNLSKLDDLLCNQEIEKIINRMPDGKFLEVMYHNGVIDSADESIKVGCKKLGVEVEAAKVGHRYYGAAMNGVFVNKLVHVSFTSEPELKTLKPRGSRKGMKLFDLTGMSDDKLKKLSETRDLALSVEQMKRLVEIQKEMKLPKVTDVFLETFAARWSDHCDHGKWKKLGLFKILKSATERIKNSNLISAFIDNAGGWKFFDNLVVVFKLETHNSPTQGEPYGGQMTKIGGVLRDIFAYALGAFIIGIMEMTVLGEFIHKKFKGLRKYTLPAQTIAQETIRAIADYGNRMGIPMMLARMFSHPNFGGKAFALGGAVGIIPEKYAQKGKPRLGDLIVMVGSKTGNDGYHGATVSSGEFTEFTDTGDKCHVQIGNPYIEQKMMRATVKLRDEGCVRAKNDYGAAGIVSSVGEMGEGCGPNGGALVNLALVPLKCAGLENDVIALSESQERMTDCVIPEKLKKAMEIYERYELEATIIGIFTGNGRFQLIYDESLTEFTKDTALSGEIALDVPYKYFKNYPLPDIKVIEPPKKKGRVIFPEITADNVENMAVKTVSHFDVCNQKWATTQYDATVQGRTCQGPLYGVNYNIGSSLAVSRPIYGKNYGLTISQSFSPWQFEVDPVQAAINAVMDAIVTQVIAGVKITDICLADNFYTPNMDKYAYWYLVEQVKAICELSVELRTPFITGKDSSSGSSTFHGLTVNVLPSVAITAMGKITNAKQLILHQWKAPGNRLFQVGLRSQTLNGSILSSALGIQGNYLEGLSIDSAKDMMEMIYKLARSGIIESGVPINRGGLMLRIFEGVEASGYGIETYLDKELFSESFGSVLVEVKEDNIKKLEKMVEPELLMSVGTITDEKQMRVQGNKLNWHKLYNPWNTRFLKEVRP